MIVPEHERYITELVNGWIEARNKMVARQGFFDPSHIEFIRELQGTADRLKLELPIMTLAQWEGFSELVNTILSMIRQQEAAFKRIE